MPAPQFVRRSYAGGAQAAQIVTNMGSTDTTFTIASTTGWVEEDGSPLGTVGPFTVAIDLYTPTVEKVLCSAVNLSTGVVTVYVADDGWSGRGYDGTAPQAHVSGGSQSGVQPCWSSVEAYEANQAVYDVLGGGGDSLVGVPIGSLVPFGGPSNNLPTNFLVANAAAISRATYAACFAAITLAGTGTTTSGGATITAVSTAVTANTMAGFKVTLTNSGGAVYTVQSVTSTTIVLTSGTGVTAGTAGGIIIYPHGAGDGTTTFNLPDTRGRGLVGSGGVNTQAQPTVYAGQTGGLQYINQTSAQQPGHSHTATVSDPGHGHVFNSSGDQVYVAPGSSSIGFSNGTPYLTTLTTPTVQGNVTSITVANSIAGNGGVAGNGGNMNIESPFVGITYIIRVE